VLTLRPEWKSLKLYNSPGVFHTDGRPAVGRQSSSRKRENQGNLAPVIDRGRFLFATHGQQLFLRRIRSAPRLIPIRKRLQKRHHILDLRIAQRRLFPAMVIERRILPIHIPFVCRRQIVIHHHRAVRSPRIPFSRSRLPLHIKPHCIFPRTYSPIMEKHLPRRHVSQRRSPEHPAVAVLRRILPHRSAWSASTAARPSQSIPRTGTTCRDLSSAYMEFTGPAAPCCDESAFGRTAFGSLRSSGSIVVSNLTLNRGVRSR